MKNALPKLAVDLLGCIDIFPTRRTDYAALKLLISKLHPISSGKKLVRLGPEGDGGYLVPDDLDDIEACFSPGVGAVSGFEEDCAGRGMEVFLADRSVDGPAFANARFHFIKRFVGATVSPDVITMDAWVEASLPGSSDLLLQIDVEGCEYETVLSMPYDLLKRFRIIVAEFHRLNMLYSKPFFSIAAPTFEKLLQTHACVHAHPNNVGRCIRSGDLEIPDLMEFTFLRRDRMAGLCFADVFPHPLDSDNDKMRRSLCLPSCWYRHNGGALS